MRKSAAQRGYDSRWQRLRAKWLKANPLCAYCLKAGKRQLGSHVGHIVPHKGDRALFYNLANLETVCFHHKNAAKQGKGPIGETPKHHWNK